MAPKGGISLARNSTSAEVAKAAGVSKWTVIRAFTPGARIANDTRERVLGVARTLDYRPNLVARSLANGTTRSVAVLVDDFANPYKLPTLECLTAALQAHGRLVTLINVNPGYDHFEAIAAARQRQFDAIVLFGTDFRDALIIELTGMTHDFPLFVLARESTVATVPCVTCDSQNAIDELCRHFAAKGYRRPGFIAGPQAVSTALGRQRAFREFWARRDVPVVFETEVPRYDHAIAAAAVSTYLAANPPGDRCDLLMCENDILAIGAMGALRRAGVGIPDEMAVAGFDDIDMAGMTAFDLTTYNQPYEAMVDALVDMLVGRTSTQSLRLKGRLVVRGSA